MMNVSLWFMIKDLLPMVLLLLLVVLVFVMLSLNKMTIMIVVIGKILCLVKLLIRLRFGIKGMVLEVPKKNLVLQVLMKNASLWSKLKDLMLMVLLLTPEGPVLVMLNLIKLTIMIVAVGKTLCLVTL